MYDKLVKELSPTNTGEMPATSINGIKEICSLVKPVSILEIGFNRGSSALMWLLNSEATLTSIDVRREEDISDSISTLKSNFKNRFSYHRMSAYQDLHLMSDFVGKFDLIFIDCWHVPIGYEADTNTALYFGSKYIAYDDYVSHSYSSFVQQYIKNNINTKEIKRWNYGTGQGLVENINHTKTRGSLEISSYITSFLERNKDQINKLNERYDY